MCVWAARQRHGWNLFALVQWIRGGAPDLLCCCAVIDFEGDRTLKALTKFIKEHAVIPYELKKKADAEAEAEADTDETSDPADAPEPSIEKDEL